MRWIAVLRECEVRCGYKKPWRGQLLDPLYSFIFFFFFFPITPLSCPPGHEHASGVPQSGPVISLICTNAGERRTCCPCAACSRGASAGWQAFPWIIQSLRNGVAALHQRWTRTFVFFLPFVSLRVLMATTLLMAHYWTIHKYCQPVPTSLFVTACCRLPLTAPHQCLPLPANKVSRAFLQVQKRPHSLPHDSPPVSTHSIWIWNSARRKSSDTGHTEWEGGREGMWSHLIVESLYSEWWQSALWLCSVRWALRLKPYTGKAPWWPWLVKCSHFHQEGASVQRLLRTGKLLLERQQLRAFGGDPCFLTFTAESSWGKASVRTGFRPADPLKYKPTESIKPWIFSSKLTVCSNYQWQSFRPQVIIIRKPAIWGYKAALDTWCCMMDMTWNKSKGNWLRLSTVTRWQCSSPGVTILFVSRNVNVYMTTA